MEDIPDSLDEDQEPQRVLIRCPWPYFLFGKNIEVYSLIQRWDISVTLEILEMFLREPSWCMEDILDSKDDVYKLFWVHQWICLKKYLQFDV